MSFYIYDIGFLIIFSLGVGLFLWSRKKNLQRDGIMYLYRTRVGMRVIDYVGSRYKRTLGVLGFVGVMVGYFLMASMIYFLYQLIYIYVFVPDVVRAIKIPPLMPLIPYLPEAFKIDFLPPFYFTYWIISIAVIAIFHEFAHGIMMKKYGIGIKSTGFGFLGPFLAAFVEQDEESFEKASKYEQIVVLSAGVFTNFVLAIFFFLLLSVFFVAAYIPAGALFNTYTPGLVGVGSIEQIGGQVVSDRSVSGLLYLINENNLTDDLILGSNGNALEFTRIVADGRVYYITLDKLKLQLEGEGDEVALYLDLPAINAGLRGVIVEVDGQEIKDHDDLAGVLGGFSPGDEVKIVTNYEGEDSEEILEYDLVLGEDPGEEGRAVMGIGFASRGEKLLGKVTDMFNFFKKPATNYEPRFNVELAVFIYNLIWWLALINLSVALVNMWPVGIFDGGRMFMLTVWALTGSEKVGKLAFKIATYLILGALLVLMVGWAGAVF